MSALHGSHTVKLDSGNDCSYYDMITSQIELMKKAIIIIFYRIRFCNVHRTV